MSANKEYTPDNAQDDFADNDYASRTGQNELKVEKDTDTIDSGVNPETEDSDEQLAKDDTDAIDESNMVSGRTRGAGKPKGTYTEPGDEEGLPSEDGTSALRK
ncbi:hypothetical protein K402DRAFT_331570 [Aulographum hederae CBS 113979]|uniref:Histone chaperone domain-containing protein n=1 Tax=Aulographum hederae CBS 113979 TaxID=1176131 RepID=A0A6G1H273_9PEZI|nr:hypothetical protein K402DRAFT_331570 [Aulographum hederae CBS 113979]